MSKVHRRGSAQSVKRLRRNTKKPCRCLPKAPQGVAIFLLLRERVRHLRYDAVVTCDQVTDDSDGFPVEVQSYDFQLQARHLDDTLVTVTDSGSHSRQVLRTKHKAAPASGDADDELTAVVRNLAHPALWKWRARVRAVGREGRKGAWSSWTAAFLPESAAVLGPTSVKAVRKVDGVRCEWVLQADDVDGGDALIPHQRISHEHVQLSTALDFASVAKNVYFKHGEAHTFHLLDPDVVYYMRVRTVSAHGDKSAWVPATKAGNSDPGAAAEGVKPKREGHTTPISWVDDPVAKVYPHRIKNPFKHGDSAIVHWLELDADTAPGSGGFVARIVKNGTTVLATATVASGAHQVRVTDANYGELNDDTDYLQVEVTAVNGAKGCTGSIRFLRGD